VAHIVGYRARHAADCRHPVCLYQLVLHAPLRFVSAIQASALFEHEDIAAV
jgi:hypothetical protein